MNKLLSSVEYVVTNSDYVKIDEEAIDRYVAGFQSMSIDHWMQACPFNYRACPNIEDEIDRWFLSDAMAYCFWGYPSKWTVEYEGKKIDGWWALLATMQRAIEAGEPLLEGSYLAKFDEGKAKELFAGDPIIPLFKERIEDFQQIGKRLVNSYNGRFHNYLLQSPSDATEFVFDLAQKFPTFYDISTYKGQPVYFYKKAQLLAHDLSVGFGHSKYVSLTGLDQLTGEADYKVPAILRRFGILKYEQDLTEKIDQRIVLPPDSKEEIEIRSAMLWACNLIVQKLKPKYPDMNALTLDGILWVSSQQKSDNDKPYHLTLTIAY